MGTVAKRTSKAAMIADKQRAIVTAAHQHFLRDGFAEASMDAIAKTAGVSVKTIYSHFANKADLFSKVMIAACTTDSLSSEFPSAAQLAQRYAWFSNATERGLIEAGRDYLTHLLSEEQLALYRVLMRDAARFPELGSQYHQTFVQGRTGILAAYFTSIAEEKLWEKRDARRDAALFEALLRAGIYEEVLHGLSTADATTIERQADAAARMMWELLATGNKER